LNLDLHVINLSLHIVNGVRRLRLVRDYFTVKEGLIRALVNNPSNAMSDMHKLNMPSKIIFKHDGGGRRRLMLDAKPEPWRRAERQPEPGRLSCGESAPTPPSLRVH
jgi:hypothetical protein